MSGAQEYRQLPDHKVRAAEYKIHLVIGKALISLSAIVSGLIAVGGVSSHGYGLSWLFVLPVGLLGAAFWKGFPAFCRCPECKKRMASRRKEGSVIRTGKYFDELGPVKRYLVCDRCRLYLFVGESQD